MVLTMRGPLRWAFFFIGVLFAIRSASAGPVSVWSSPTLSGEWDGIRGANSSVSISVSYTQEYLGVVSGGLQRIGRYNALAVLDLDVNLEKLAGWPGAQLHAAGYAIIGSSLSAEAIGDDSNVSNINYRNSVRLFEIYLEQKLFNQRLVDTKTKQVYSVTS